EQEGVIIGIDYKKLNAKLNVTHQATDKLKIDFGVSASHQKLHTNSDAGSAANPVRALFRVVPWEPVYNEDGTYNTDILLTYNPVGLVNENIRETKLYGILRSEEHTSELQSRENLVCRLLLETKKHTPK